MFDCERECWGRIGRSGVDGNKDETSSSKEKVDWYGLPEAALEASEPVPVFSLLVRPPQFSLML